MTQRKNEIVCDGCGASQMIFHPSDYKKWFEWEGWDYCEECKKEGDEYGEWRFEPKKL